MIGYTCKSCGGPAPTGVGYTVFTEDAAKASLDALEAGSCGCGHSIVETPAVGNVALSDDYMARARSAKQGAFDASENASDNREIAETAATVERSAPAAARARRCAHAAAVQYGLVKVYVEAAQRLNPRECAGPGVALVGAAETSVYIAEQDAADAEMFVREDRRAGRREGKV